ncbi:MAG: hypothetical protein J6J60_07565 [Clostridia bacterium]|nr:hypothetical protein [Clostridia bacterium]
MNSILELKKRSKLVLIFFVLGSIIVSIKLAHLQFVKGPELSVKAEEQINSSRGINSKRGTIYDSTEKNILAQSSTVYTITVNPINIKKEDKEKVARMFVEVFDLNYDKVLKSVNKRSSIEYIVKKVEKEKTDKVRMWMAENNILTGINIDEDTKRYYPYSNLASQVIGFCGSDNQGLDGIEAKYDDILTGKKGSIEKATDAKGNNFGTEGEKYVDPIDGNNIVLSIDMTVQSIVEKYLEEACIDNVCTDGGNVIVMNPKNGDILAMATYPGYDLNSPYEITDENLKSLWNDMEQGEKNKALQALWRNKAIADTYEPGSTFKLVTASAAIEEGLANSDNAGAFGCSGSIEIAGVRIKCWRYYRPHGSQSLRQALMNSCNPVFIGLGQKLGVKTYYKYLEKFGFLQKTGIDLYGEAKSIFLKEEKVGPVELATISFGQRFEVTPIQMSTMVSTIANNGKYVKPRVLKKIINSQNGETTEIEPQFGNQVISSETAQSVLSMMQSVVAEGTGKNAQVKGISVGGKTGTSEDGVNTGKYVTSFIGVAPIEDPQVTILITLYNPTGEGGHQGGGVAAPLGGQILNEVLPYLGVQAASEVEN